MTAAGAAVCERGTTSRPWLTWLTWRSQLGSILGWGLGLTVYGLLTLTFYPSVQASAEPLLEYMENLPAGMRAFLGSIEAFTSPGGFLELEFLNYYILLLGIYAIIAGGTVVAGEEEAGTLDLLLALPLSRPRVLLERWAGLALSLVSAAVVLFLGMWASAVLVGYPLGSRDMAVAVFGGLPGVIFILSLTVLLSALLRRRRQAGLVAAGWAVGSFLLTGLGRVSESIEPYRPLSYLTYFEAPLTRGVDWAAGALVLAAALVMVLAAALAFRRRDILTA